METHPACVPRVKTELVFTSWTVAASDLVILLYAWTVISVRLLSPPPIPFFEERIKQKQSLNLVQHRQQ
jgi:hypothetical protein